MSVSLRTKFKMALASLALAGSAMAYKESQKPEQDFCARDKSGDLVETHDGGRTFSKMSDRWTVINGKHGGGVCQRYIDSVTFPEQLPFKGSTLGR